MTTEVKLCVICGHYADHAIYECEATAYPKGPESAFAQYQRKASGTARQDAPALGVKDNREIAAALGAFYEKAQRVERLKKRLFHVKQSPVGDTVTFYTGDFPKNTLILNWLLGLVGEVGEVVKAILLKEPEDAIKKEIGDVGWYLAMICTELGYDLGEIFEMNLAKLKERHGEKFTQHLEADENLVKLADRASRGKIKGSGDER